MYTIGQIANIMGISRDKLRYYEEKGVLRPEQNDDNNYRQYDIKDIITVLSIEFYRSMDIDFKTIKKIHDQSAIKDIERVLDKKRDEVINEIERLSTIVKRLDKALKECSDIENYLGKFIIKSMNPVKVLGEISDFKAFEEFDNIHKNRKELEDAAIIKSLRRYLTYDEKGLISSRMLITKDLDIDAGKDEDGVLCFDKCVFTVVEDGFGRGNVMEETFKKSKEWIHANNYRDIGIAILNMALIEPKGGRTTSYLEVYIPIE